MANSLGKPYFLYFIPRNYVNHPASKTYSLVVNINESPAIVHSLGIPECSLYVSRFSHSVKDE